MARQPSKPTKNGVVSFLTSAAKFAFQGAVVYLAVTALQGKHGKERLKEDFHAVAVCLLFPFCSMSCKMWKDSLLWCGVVWCGVVWCDVV